MTKETLGHSFKAIDMGNNSYVSPEMIEVENVESDAALKRMINRDAQQHMKHMLHLDSSSADAFGGEEKLLERLKVAYTDSLLNCDNS